MKRYLPIASLLLLGLMLQPFVITFGQTTEPLNQIPIDSEENDDDDPGPNRVARITFLEGDVSFLRSGESEWAAAVENLPVLEGEQVYTGAGGRVEIQLGRGTYLRLSERTSLTIVALNDSTAQLELAEGIINVRVDHLSAAFDRFEIDTPSAALVLEKDGVYRISVGEKGDSEVIVRRG
jgi:ferric-dicitrate binding protein FerR (iron transport regulator)